MSKYLLPCECGQGIAIDVSQAGQQLVCECGETLEVPTLRGVRALEPLQTETPSSPRAADWDLSRGMIFAGSLILSVIGFSVALFAYNGLRGTPNITREVELESFDEAVDDLSLDEAYEMWKNLRNQGLGPRGQNPYVNFRSFRSGRQRILAVGIVLCVAGLLVAIGATLGRRKPAA